jgi:hypothetical protein
VSTIVRVSSAVYSATHVATNMLRGLKQVIVGCGLDARKFGQQFEVLENGVTTWVRSRHLRELVLEVWDPKNPDRLVGRFDFTIDYDYYGSGDGDLWLDSETVAWAIKKNGADTAPGAASVYGWSNTTLRNTTGLRRHSVGTALGGGSTGAGLSYWN